LSLEIDGLLPPDSLHELDRHLETCDDCLEYRADLQLGQRLLAATEPELPENFEWKLRLKLNQTIREAAGRTEYPWFEEQVDRWRWVRNFTSAAAVGLAAVLSVAMFMGGPLDNGPATPDNPLGGPTTELASDRLPLDADFRTGRAGTRAVSSQSPFMRQNTQPNMFAKGWSGQSIQDLQTINRLRVENQQLTNALIQGQIELRWLRAQLDTSGSNTLDLEETR